MPLSIEQKIVEKTTNSLRETFSWAPNLLDNLFINTEISWVKVHCEALSGLLVRQCLYDGISDSDKISRYFLDAHFHDIGKLLVPVAVVNKPGKYTTYDKTLMAPHPRYSKELLIETAKIYDIPNNQNKLVLTTADDISHHHEIMNGTMIKANTDPELYELILQLSVWDIANSRSSGRPYTGVLDPELTLSDAYKYARTTLNDRLS